MPRKQKPFRPRKRKVGSCGLCWANKHKCEGGEALLQDSCRICKNIPNIGSSSTLGACLYPRQDIERDVLQNWQTTWPTHGYYDNQLIIDITSQTSQKTELHIPFRFEGLLSDQAWETMSNAIDHGLKSSACSLNPVDEESQLVQHAALAGAYLHIICSTQRTTEQVQTLFNGGLIENDSLKHIEPFLRLLFMSQLGSLIDEILLANWQGRTLTGEFTEPLVGYAAATILFIEVRHFRSSLRNGHLAKLASADLKGPFLDWLDAVENELRDLLRSGCDMHSTWKSCIKGSLKDFRKFRSDHEILSINYQLVQNFVHLENQDPWSAAIPYHEQYGVYDALSQFSILHPPFDTGQYYQGTSSQGTVSQELEFMSMEEPNPYSTTSLSSQLSTPFEPLYELPSHFVSQELVLDLSHIGTAMFDTSEEGITVPLFHPYSVTEGEGWKTPTQANISTSTTPQPAQTLPLIDTQETQAYIGDQLTF